MRTLSLNDDNIVINAEILYEASQVIELESGETTADFERIQNLTNDEILDEMDYDTEPYSMHNDALGEQGYYEYDDMDSMERDKIVFVRILDMTKNLTEDQLIECAFYMPAPEGYAYEIVDRDVE